jgi:hypothetical protein
MASTFFTRLYRCWCRIVWSVSRHALGDQPADLEITSRYLRSSGHYVASKSRVKPQAFMPALSDNKTSVFRVQGLTEGQVWCLGEAFLMLPPHKALVARAEISVAHIRSVNLQVRPTEPPPRHADITDWPIEKHEAMSRAQELAAEAVLRLRHP